MLVFSDALTAGAHCAHIVQAPVQENPAMSNATPRSESQSTFKAGALREGIAATLGAIDAMVRGIERIRERRSALPKQRLEGRPVLVVPPLACAALLAIAGVLASAAHAQICAWGGNAHGQIGDGTDNNLRLTPVPTSGLTGMIAIECGDYHSMAISSTGQLRTWGFNGDGELGIGINSARSDLPVLVTSLSNVIAISGGSQHSLAVTNPGGIVWGWGNNAQGQVGDNTTTFRNAPVQAVGLSAVTAVS